MGLLFKYLSRDFLAKRTMVSILSLIIIFTSFMYFFVHFAIDANLLRLGGEQLSGNEANYFTALKSNQLLIRNITVAMVAIFSLILFLFIRGTLQRNRVQLAQLMSLGFSFSSVLAIYGLLISGLSLVSSLLGLVLGFWGSDILLSANSQTYLVQGLSKGLSLQSIMTGTLFLSLFLGAIVYLAGLTVRKTDVALMMKQTDGKAIRSGLIEKIIQKLPMKHKFKFKLTLNHFSTLGLLLSAIVTFSIMFVLSLSLTFSSSKILESQKNGRHYSYDISYDNYQKEEANLASDSVTYLKYDVDLMIKGEAIAYQALSFTSQNDLFQLIDSKGEMLDPTQGVYVNPELRENYGLKVGDTLELRVKGKRHQIKIAGFAENADLKTIYIPRDQASAMVNEADDRFNGRLTNQSQEKGEGKVRSLEEKLSDVQRSQTSNRASAIINQSIGVITGCLLIYLAVFIGLNGNIQTLLMFDLLGYEEREVYRILLNPYIVISNLLFFLTLPVAIYAARNIQIMTSLQTGDYMPFQLNWITFVYMFAILNVLILVIRFLFIRKVKKIRDDNRQAEFLSEW
ncbi:ABC transporter permease [Streptococcus mutans]|uniref:FtsX-like permease family protein n=2 Tax=Streptococcus mutans TaxID=1309 RepID=UPI0002B59194|nr:FtsX-like permease family protein [Streptococcus mutans]EMB85470.1 putative permease [Streptococcus mutans N29]EMB89158.1 putative permease [Streptococcus mutans NMT4863]MCB5051790.1 FtsX-like permease family protein [Streptococcus mutans]MCB5062751.1 FtsX-like permease family protein [Streptococcus mutans]MDB8631934.1 FtsX-like permease family protein [Streptococcus mutans]